MIYWGERLNEMLSSSRFVVAIHALSVLARSASKGPVCSSAIADSVHTNPVVIRRLMAELEKAKLVRSIAGRSGGFALDRTATGITLADIYLAVGRCSLPHAQNRSGFEMSCGSPNESDPFTAAARRRRCSVIRARENHPAGRGQRYSIVALDRL